MSALAWREGSEVADAHHQEASDASPGGLFLPVLLLTSAVDFLSVICLSQPLHRSTLLHRFSLTGTPQHLPSEITI